MRRQTTPQSLLPTMQLGHFLSRQRYITAGPSEAASNSRLRRDFRSVLNSCTPISAGAMTSTARRQQPRLARRLQVPPRVTESDCAATASWPDSIISSAGRLFPARDRDIVALHGASVELARTAD